MFKKCILILAASCMMYSCATQTESNPFLNEFQTPTVWQRSYLFKDKRRIAK